MASTLPMIADALSGGTDTIAFLIQRRDQCLADAVTARRVLLVAGWESDYINDHVTVIAMEQAAQMWEEMRSRKQKKIYGYED